MRVKYYFENLMIEEICLTYFDYLKQGDSNEDATSKTIVDYEQILYSSSLESIMAWISFGYYQWELGRLIPSVKQNARQAYLDLLEHKEEFLLTDPYKNYVDRRYAPITTHEQMLKQADHMIKALDKSMKQEKKLRSQSFFKKLDKLINHGVYAYRLDCDIIHQQGKDCYVYFVIDIKQREGTLAEKDSIPLYLYNLYSVGKVLDLEQIIKSPILEASYNIKTKNDPDSMGKIIHKLLPDVPFISSIGSSALFTQSKIPQMVYNKIMLLGVARSLLIISGEKDIRHKNRRNRISYFRLEHMGVFLEDFLSVADMYHEICGSNQLIRYLDISDYVWDDLE